MHPRRPSTRNKEGAFCRVAALRLAALASAPVLASRPSRPLVSAAADKCSGSRFLAVRCARRRFGGVLSPVPSPLPPSPPARSSLACPAGGVMPPLCFSSAPLGGWGLALCARSSPRQAPHIRGARSLRPLPPRSAAQSPRARSLGSGSLRVPSPRSEGLGMVSVTSGATLGQL